MTMHANNLYIDLFADCGAFPIITEAAGNLQHFALSLNANSGLDNMSFTGPTELFHD